MKRSDNLSIVGIIAEFNPLHNGHKLLINEAKKLGTVVCVISGNFVQRGDTAIFEKQLRCEAALKCGADLVIEMPVCYSMSTAQSFATAGVALLNAIGCDTLMFGSEIGKTESLIKAAKILESEDFSKKLPLYLEQGLTFAKARQLAAEDLGVEKNILDGANNNLGVEYILAARQINPNLTFKTVKRLGAMHDSLERDNDFVSATLLRQKIKQNDMDFCRKYLPQETVNLTENADYSDINRIEKSILSVLRSKAKAQLSNLPDLSEGIENKLYNSIKLATGLEMLYNDMKVKRYTMARIRRLVLSAFIGIDETRFSKIPPYLRILGFSKAGEDVIKQNAKSSSVPVCLRAAEIEGLNPQAQYVFETESRATDLYALSFEKPLTCGLEYTRKITKI